MKKLGGFNDDGESWWQIGKNGRIFFDRPKPTVGCSASGRRRRVAYIIYVIIKYNFTFCFGFVNVGTNDLQG
jgi:hypothetical protein